MHIIYNIHIKNSKVIKHTDINKISSRNATLWVFMFNVFCIILGVLYLEGKIVAKIEILI